MSIPLPPAGTNPVMDAEGTHYGVARLSFVAGVAAGARMGGASQRLTIKGAAMGAGFIPAR